jgi:hypothetical protein
VVTTEKLEKPDLVSRGGRIFFCLCDAVYAGSGLPLGGQPYCPGSRGGTDAAREMAGHVNLQGKMITPVAQLIKARGCPIIFATAYGPDVLPEEFRDHPFLQKPLELEALAKAIDEMFRSRSR